MKDNRYPKIRWVMSLVRGQGLVLASSIIVSQFVDGGLLTPYRPDICVAGAAYTALCVFGRERHPPVRVFLEWLTREWTAQTLPQSRTARSAVASEF
jgi:DNA-binding transcriptional LysR family regulator